MPYDTLLTCRHFKYVILYTTTTHVFCVYAPMQCALSCICLCHVLVCAGSELASVLQFFTVLVVYSWCLLIIPLFSSISLAPIAYFIVLELYFLLSFLACPSSVVLRLFSALLTSSLPPPSLYHSAPDWLHLPPPQGGPTVTCCCRTGGPQASTPHHCKVSGRGQPCQALTNMPCCRDFHQ